MEALFIVSVAFCSALSGIVGTVLWYHPKIEKYQSKLRTMDLLAQSVNEQADPPAKRHQCFHGVA